MHILLYHTAASVLCSFSLVFLYWYVSFACLALMNSQAVGKPVWHIPLLCVQWKTPDDGQRNCLNHVEFYSKNKFEKLVHLVGFIIWILIPLLKNMGTCVCHGIILWSTLMETLYCNLWVKFTLYLFSCKYYLNIFLWCLLLCMYRHTYWSPVTHLLHFHPVIYHKWDRGYMFKP